MLLFPIKKVEEIIKQTIQKYTNVDSYNNIPKMDKSNFKIPLAKYSPLIWHRYIYPLPTYIIYIYKIPENGYTAVTENIVKC